MKPVFGIVLHNRLGKIRSGRRAGDLLASLPPDRSGFLGDAGQTYRGLAPPPSARR